MSGSRFLKCGCSVIKKTQSSLDLRYGILRCSGEWNKTYGAFSRGVDENDVPYHWNSDAIHLFGYSNKGVSALILSIKYSIGYISVSDAREMDVDYASLENANGALVRAEVNFFLFSWNKMSHIKQELH